MTNQKFRILLCAYALFALAGGASAFLPDDYSAELSAAFDEETSHIFELAQWPLFLAMGVFAALAIAGFIGMFLFKPWGRSLSLITTVVGLLFYPFLGPTLTTGLATALFEASSITWGAALGLAYYSNVSASFER